MVIRGTQSRTYLLTLCALFETNFRVGSDPQLSRDAYVADNCGSDQTPTFGSVKYNTYATEHGWTDTHVPRAA